MENSAKACNVMRSKLGFSKGHDISLQDLSHSSLAQQPSKPGKNGTVRTTQRTHGVSTYKLHCTAKTAKFFLARKLTAKQVQKHAEHAESNTDHVAATADHASEKQRAPYQVTEHAPTHKGTKQRFPQKPNFRRGGQWPKSQKSRKPCRRPRPLLGEGLWLCTRYSGGLPTLKALQGGRNLHLEDCRAPQPGCCVGGPREGQHATCLSQT